MCFVIAEVITHECGFALFKLFGLIHRIHIGLALLLF